MKNWPGTPGFEPAAPQADERVGPDRLDRDDREPKPAERHVPGARGCRRGVARAIASTAAAAPEIVVTQGTRASERRLADEVAVRAGAPTVRRVDDELDLAAPHEVDDGRALARAPRPCARG